MYKVILEDAIYKNLSKISKDIAERIRDKVYNHLALAPRELGIMLAGDYNDVYKYRCHDDYRVLYRILESEKTIVIKKIGHRRDVYKSK